MSPRPTALAADCQAGVAQARSEQRRRDAGACRRKLGPDTQSPLWRTVIDGLRCRWSPQRIAGELPSMNKSAGVAAQARPLVVISEIGTDMGHFPSDKHVASWLGSCPGTKITGGKVLSGKTSMLTKGEAYTDQGQAYDEERYRQRVLHNLDRRAQQLGMKFVPTENAPAAA